jgi:hypothetical protein
MAFLTNGTCQMGSRECLEVATCYLPEAILRICNTKTVAFANSRRISSIIGIGWWDHFKALFKSFGPIHSRSLDPFRTITWLLIIYLFI